MGNGNLISNYIYAGGSSPFMRLDGSGNSIYYLTDGNGNLISNYIYAGGSSPFMRLDAGGNPVYYLTDGMGSTIGLADGTGQGVAKFNYDS